MALAITRTLKANNKTVYVSLLSILTFFLLLDYIPGMHALSAWVTPPLALFLGLAFALICGQAHPKFNKKTSKYLLLFTSKAKAFIVDKSTIENGAVDEVRGKISAVLKEKYYICSY